MDKACGYLSIYARHGYSLNNVVVQLYAVAVL